MDSSNQLDVLDVLVDDLVFKLEKIGRKVHQRSRRVSLTGSNVTSCSVTDDDERPLSHAEEGAIEECLNDTEGSLSNVDLNIFDDISDDLNMHRTKKTRKQRMTDRVNMDYGGNSTDYNSSDSDEAEVFRTSSLTENSLDNPVSMISKTEKINSQDKIDHIVTAKEVFLAQENILRRQKGLQDYLRNYSDLPSSNNNTGLVRQDQRNSSPIKKNNNTHVYSFFSSMADLVSTFPDKHVATAKQNVNIILLELIDKLKKWYNNEDPMNSTHGFNFDLSDYNLLQDKLARLQDIN